MSAINRDIALSVEYLLEHFPAVLVLGARQIGKTTLLTQLRPNAPFFDLESPSDLEKIEDDPEFLLAQYTDTVVIDEAQSLPSLFPVLRVLIDKRRSRTGQFLLSGSSSPLLIENITETLAGRVAIVELGGFSLQESWQLTDSPFYSWVRGGSYNALPDFVPRTSQDQLWQSCIYGQYPEPFLKRKETRFHTLWMENYFATYVRRDISTLFSGLNLNAYQRFIRMLAHSTGTIINASEFARSLSVSQPTVRSYLDIIAGTFLWRNLESYQKNIQRRVSKMPKGHLKDSGLLCHLLGIRDTETLLSHPGVGRIWEGFIIEELIKEFEARLIKVSTYYYRTHNQAEIDLILEGEFGTLPIEIKLGRKTDRRQIATLKAFISEQKLPLGLVINNAEHIEWLAPKVVQIPATFL
jgi:predicted AAA+ superfamily ATPase